MLGIISFSTRTWLTSRPVSINWIETMNSLYSPRERKDCLQTNHTSSPAHYYKYHSQVIVLFRVQDKIVVIIPPATCQEQTYLLHTWEKNELCVLYGYTQIHTLVLLIAPGWIAFEDNRKKVAIENNTLNLFHIVHKVFEMGATKIKLPTQN